MTASASASASLAAAPGGTEAAASCHLVTYIEVGAAAARSTAARLRRFAVAGRAQEGCALCTVLRESGRPGRFAMLESWRGRNAPQSHEAAVRALAAELDPVLAAPLDRRPSTGLLAALPPADAAPGLDTVCVVLTHVDVVPPAKDEAIAQLLRLAEHSVAEPGALRIEILQQDSRPNHFTLVEMWRDGAARDAHVMAAHTRAFRQGLAPLAVALYDERLYATIR